MQFSMRFSSNSRQIPFKSHLYNIPHENAHSEANLTNCELGVRLICQGQSLGDHTLGIPCFEIRFVSLF